MVEHKLVKLEEHPGSYPQYRGYVECSCGFQARVPTKALAESQFKAHLSNHGIVEEDQVAKAKAHQQVKAAHREAQQQGKWQPNWPAGK